MTAPVRPQVEADVLDALMSLLMTTPGVESLLRFYLPEEMVDSLIFLSDKKIATKQLFRPEVLAALGVLHKGWDFVPAESEQPKAAPAKPDVAPVQPVIPAAPASPGNLQIAAGDMEATLTWDDPGNSAITGYEIAIDVDGAGYGAFTAIAGADATTTSYTATGLTNGSTYAFKIRAVIDTTMGDESAEVTATPAAAV